MQPLRTKENWFVLLTDAVVVVVVVVVVDYSVDALLVAGGDIEDSEGGGI